MQNRQKLLQQIKAAEQKFMENDYKGGSVRSCIVEKYGDTPILLSAPHSIKQIRRQKIKAHEFYTGAITECLAKQISCSCITKQYLSENTTIDDPNTSKASCSYKTAVSQFLQQHKIKLFVDIHGLLYTRDTIVDICIDNGKNINDMSYVKDLQQIIENKFGTGTASIDKYFSASSDVVMSKWVHTMFDITAIQLEINGLYRGFDNENEQQSLDFFLCLKQWLNNISDNNPCAF